MGSFSFGDVIIWLVLLLQVHPRKLLELLLQFYWWFNNVPENERKVHANVMPIFHIVFITDVVQSMVFPTMVDLCHFVIFNDRVFLSWITAVHHLGAAFGGVLTWAVSYWRLERHLYRVPKIASVMLALHMVLFLQVLHMNSMVHHVVWHGVYYVIYSFQQLAVCNVMVASVGPANTGSYLTLSSAIAKLGNISGPMSLILISSMQASNFTRYSTPFKLRNADIAYLFVLFLCVMRTAFTLMLENPYETAPKGALADCGSVVLPTTSDGHDNLELSSPEKGDRVKGSGGSAANNRHRILPYVIFAMNVISLIGAGISIRFMFLYVVLKFNVEYSMIWFANICVPFVSTIVVLVLDKLSRKYGRLVTIFSSQSLAIVLLYMFIKLDSAFAALAIYVVRSTLQNSPNTLKTAIMLKYSSERENGYWLASDQISRVIIFASTIVGGHLSNYAGIESCLKVTMYFYAAAQLLLLPCLFLFPEV